MATRSHWPHVFVGSGFTLKNGGFGLLVESRFSTMGLPCKECSQSFPPGHTFEFIVYNERAYFFCSKGCKDKWMSVDAPEIDLENLQQATL